jgi:hypothetical protein
MMRRRFSILLAGFISAIVGLVDGAPLIEYGHNVAGAAAANLRSLTTTTKAPSAFSIAANKLRAAPATNPGRFVLSANGSTSFDFGVARAVKG